MTSPQPPAPTQDPPAPPPAPAPQPAPAPAPADPAAELRAALEAERNTRKELETKIAQLTQATMSETEKAVAKAREEGKAEASAASALILVAAEFRIAAAGKIANIDAAVDMLDLSKLLDADGKPDRKKIEALVAQLAAVPPPGGHVPAGPRTPAANGNEDWLRSIRRTR
jgi:hypothetical protein